MTSEKIVIVDDDPAMREALRRLLGAAGLTAVGFPSSEALLASGAATEAACLVVDIRLPGMSGFELHERLSELDPCAPVVFITAYDDEKARDEAIRRGAEGYFVKPFPGRQLIDVVRDLAGAVRQDSGR